jgi:hypothetical protein
LAERLEKAGLLLYMTLINKAVIARSEATKQSGMLEMEIDCFAPIGRSQ